MPRPTVISIPRINESFGSSLDVEALGAPPRKMSVDSVRSQGSRSIRFFDVDKPLPPRPDSRLSYRRAVTPDLYRGGESEESVKSESPPPTTPFTFQSTIAYGDSKPGSKRSSISSLGLDEGGAEFAESDQFRLEGPTTFVHPFDYDEVPYRQAYSSVSLQK